MSQSPAGEHAHDYGQAHGQAHDRAHEQAHGQAHEHAHYWRHPELPEVDLLSARFVQHTFARHTHDAYVLAVIGAGVEEYHHGGALHRVGPGGMALVEPGEVHTGHAGVPEGWRYRVLYPGPELVRAIAAESGMTGTPGFQTTAPYDPEAAGLLWRAHLAFERGDPLSASSLLRTAIAHLLRVHARPSARRRQTGAVAAHSVADARDILHARLTDPPRLEDLAAQVDAAPFALLRAFRAAHGLPPHAYLNQVRVRHASALLAGGVAPVEVAARVGFTDQAHLTRHFKRHLGVTPGAYQRGVAPAGSGPSSPSGPSAGTYKTGGPSPE